ncbi:hypothetical protein HAZT_HAZT012130 [Hyalella azteca]|uniref:Uncharacterized protein n=1 Tax=Hyalella azteca TaxID=294128 RepID=A0A6A0H2X2_HYAAZ|nr:hypothetical protein HAZT_HAZT012130 [Hyalella azteca]
MHPSLAVAPISCTRHLQLHPSAAPVTCSCTHQLHPRASAAACRRLDVEAALREVEYGDVGVPFDLDAAVFVDVKHGMQHIVIVTCDFVCGFVVFGAGFVVFGAVFVVFVAFNCAIDLQRDLKGTALRLFVSVDELACCAPAPPEQEAAIFM